MYATFSLGLASGSRSFISTCQFTLSTRCAAVMATIQAPMARMSFRMVRSPPFGGFAVSGLRGLAVAVEFFRNESQRCGITPLRDDLRPRDRATSRPRNPTSNLLTNPPLHAPHSDIEQQSNHADHQHSGDAEA